MVEQGGISTCFSISDEARAEIEQIRRAWDRTTADPADVVIGWGTTVPDAGERFGGVVVSFYGRGERSGITHAIEPVSGLDVVFFVTEADAHRFHGRTLDVDTDRGFFLRP